MFGAIGLPLTLIWVLAVLYTESQPAAGQMALQLYGLMLAMVLPAVLVLLLGAAFLWRQIRRRERKTSPEMLGAALLMVITFAWMCLTGLMASEPSAQSLTGMLWAIFTLWLVVTWVVAIGVVCYRACRAPSWRRFDVLVAYLAPLVAAVGLFVFVLAYQLPMKVRFELSEGALSEAAQNGLSGQLVGLYHVIKTARKAGCVVLETQHFFGENGFAFCSGPLPVDTVIDMRHLNGCWYVFSGDSWKEHPNEWPKAESTVAECPRS